MVHLAVVAAVARRAHAAVRERVVEARAAVQARIRRALVQLGETSTDRGVGVARRARACVRVNTLCARGAVEAWQGATLVNVRLTNTTAVARNAETLVPIHRNCCNARIRTRCSIHAWSGRTFIDISVTVQCAAIVATFDTVVCKSFARQPICGQSGIAAELIA